MTQTLFYNNESLSSGTTRKFTNENVASQLSHHESLSHKNSASAADNSSLSSGQTPKPTAFEKLIDNLRNNPEYRKEMSLNKLIGFYRIGSEVGTGNFSQVKLGLHLLTRGSFCFEFSHV